MPSEKDFRDPRIGKYVDKYLKGVEGIPVENRIRIMRLIENLTMGLGQYVIWLNLCMVPAR